LAMQCNREVWAGWLDIACTCACLAGHCLYRLDFARVNMGANGAGNLYIYSHVQLTVCAVIWRVNDPDSCSGVKQNIV
jgi:hypothetical protein